MYRDCRKTAKVALLTAEQEIGLCRDSLVKGEYGQIEFQPHKVAMMDDLYKTNKRLMYWHCCNMCSIGKRMDNQYEDINPVLAGMRLISSLDKLVSHKPNLVSILEDGVISPNEIPLLNPIIITAKLFRASSMAIELEKEKIACAGTQTISL
jgi:hypothetical protein